MITSMDVSPAASRRTICSRCPSAVAGSTLMFTLYWPFDSWVQRSAIFCKLPLLFGLMYQFRVGGPEVEAPPPPQAASAPTARVDRASTAPLRRLLELRLSGGLLTDSSCRCSV